MTAAMREPPPWLPTLPAAFADQRGTAVRE